MSNDLRTPLSRVRGLGSARHGADHFLAQRISAVALCLLLPVFVVSAVVGTDGTYDSVTAWLKSPASATIVLLLALVGLFHMRLGLQVVIEDYLTKPPAKIAALVANTFIPVVLGVLAILSVLKIFVGA
jgi:succinate dehydrogenase / fumarate reductase, membrane anchor subunit